MVRWALAWLRRSAGESLQNGADEIDAKND